MNTERNREIAETISYFDAIEILFFSIKMRSDKGGILSDTLIEKLPEVLNKMFAATETKQ